MITPRPILKTRPTPSNLNEYFPSESPSTALPFTFPTSPHVHFPPTPKLTDTQMTHSPFVYDRAPIVVLPNACQLPERGGRDYSAYDIVATLPNVPSWRRRQGSDFDAHSHDDEDEDENPPPLVHDHFSESEDSDPCISSPAHADDFGCIPSKSEDDTASDVAPMTPLRVWAFLPHPHDSEHQMHPVRRPKHRRKQTGPRAGIPALDAVKDTFAGADSELSLDGCLGGF